LKGGKTIILEVCNLFRRKRTYNWTMVDIHNHMLFGVDDGAKTLEMSLEMLKMAFESGTQKVVLTPHYSPRRGKAPYKLILRNYEKLKERAAQEIPGLSLYLGREVYYLSNVFEDIDKVEDSDVDMTDYEWGTMNDVKNDFREKDLKAIRMCGTKNMIIEFSAMTDIDTIRRGISDCFMSGFQPIVAHVERYVCIVKDPLLIADLREMGAYIQINADSIMGVNGPQVKKCVKKLLSEEFVDFVASDAHNLTSRKPILSEARDYVSKKYGEIYAQNIFRNNAIKLLALEN